MNEELEPQEFDAASDTAVTDADNADNTDAANAYVDDSNGTENVDSNDAVKEDAATDEVVSEEPNAVEESPAVAQTPKQKKKAQQVASAVITPNADADIVYLSKCVYKNKYARKSLTVHHLQRRLNELGYREAYSDKDGWFGDLTRSAVAAFQKDNNLEGEGNMNVATFQAIFAGDSNVVVDIVS